MSKPKTYQRYCGALTIRIKLARQHTGNMLDNYYTVFIRNPEVSPYSGHNFSEQIPVKQQLTIGSLEAVEAAAQEALKRATQLVHNWSVRMLAGPVARTDGRLERASLYWRLAEVAFDESLNDFVFKIKTSKNVKKKV
jgi:flavin-binding protein dodecin